MTLQPRLEMGCAGGFLGDRAKKLREGTGKVRRGCVYFRVFDKICHGVLDGVHIALDLQSTDWWGLVTMWTTVVE